jgi:hypothetical protein
MYGPQFRTFKGKQVLDQHMKFIFSGVLFGAQTPVVDQLRTVKNTNHGVCVSYVNS